MELKRDTLLQGGRYRIIEPVGRGGFGITYLAEQVMAKRKVCIKEFFPKGYYKRGDDSVSLSLLSDSFKENMSRFKAKFVKEAQTIASLDHANIIHIHDVFEDNNTAYYVMEYIEGESLSAHVKRNGAMCEHDAVTYIRQVAEALDYIHNQQIMHLDIKPGNIMVRTKDNRAILIDFGLSKHYDAESGEATSTALMGVSHGFAPMEQYRDGGVKMFSPETDIYSLGATLYYLVTGSVPPQAADVADDGLPALPAHLSQGVRRAIERSMEDKRKARPQSIAEFLALMDDNQSDVTPIPIPEPVATIVSVEPIMASEATVVSVEPKSEDEATVVNVAPKSENDVVVVEDKPMQESKPAPQSRLMVAIVALMPICTLLPWTSVSAPYDGITASRLGITTWYGIAGLVSSIVVAYGVLRKRRCLTFWASVLAIVMGLIGTLCIADVSITFNGKTFTATAESVKKAMEADSSISVGHTGAILFMVASAVSAVWSFLRIIKKK